MNRIFTPLAAVIFSLLLFAQNGLAQGTPAGKIDHRVFKHYTQDQIDDMQSNDPGKIARLNHYYRNSYYIRENPNCENCPEIVADDLDISRYEHKRDLNRENTVQLTHPGHFVVLKPRTVLQQEYAQIK